MSKLKKSRHNGKAQWKRVANIRKKNHSSDAKSRANNSKSKTYDLLSIIKGIFK